MINAWNQFWAVIASICNGLAECAAMFEDGAKSTRKSMKEDALKRANQAKTEGNEE